MKLLRRLLCAAAALALVWALAVPQAVSAQAYTYTVRIYGGQQGSMAGAGVNKGRVANQGDVLVCEGLAYGDRINFQNRMVTLKDGSKYYVKGIRESGKGTEEISETGNGRMSADFIVTKDQDFVVAYGVLTNPVEYTVNYRNAAGETLAPSETYYGNVGDRPVIAYQYIEGYQPQAYNLTKTLSEDPAENVITFIYNPLPDDTVYTNTTTTTVVSQPTATTAPGTASSAAPAEESSAPASSQPEPESSQPTENVPDEDVPAASPAPPRESWNLDDGDVPLAEFGDTSLDTEPIQLNSEGQLFWQNVPLAVKIVGGVVLLGGFSFALWMLIFRRKRKEDQ